MRQHASLLPCTERAFVSVCARVEPCSLVVDVGFLCVERLLNMIICAELQVVGCHALTKRVSCVQRLRVVQVVELAGGEHSAHRLSVESVHKKTKTTFTEKKSSARLPQPNRPFTPSFPFHTHKGQHVVQTSRALCSASICLFAKPTQNRS